MKKRVLCFLCAIVLLLGVCVPVAAAESYWTLAAQYETAKKSGNDNAMISAALNIERYYSGDVSETAYLRIFDPLTTLTKAYERQGQYELCYNAYERLLACVTWLSTHASSADNRAAFYENIQAVSRKARYFRTPQLYALTTDTSRTLQYGQLNEPAAGTYTGMCDTYQSQTQSAYLLYIQYLTEEVSSFLYQIPSTDSSLYLELAWNMKNETKEELDEINSGSTDTYMKRQLQTLEQYAVQHPNVKIQLRFAAEANCWPCLNAYGSDRTKLLAFAETFKTAFRRVSNETRRLAPHVAMVLSYVDYGHWYTRPADFYPGDEYVDWVGMSTYYNPDNTVSAGIGDNSDMLVGKGLYQSTIARVGEITELAKIHQKPVMISECGFRYTDPTDSAVTATAQKLKEFYTYVNMVYPEIKVINYFNTNYGGSRYRLYPFNGYMTDSTTCPALRDMYEASVFKNGAIASTLPGSKGLASYTTLDGVNNASGEVTVSAYIGYPTTAAKTVTYKLNGNVLATVTDMPYSITLKAADMNTGTNTLTAVISCANTTVTKTSLLYVAGNGSIDGQLTAKTDLEAGAWYLHAVGYCMNEGLMNGTGDNSFSPQVSVTRAMLAQVLYRINGSPAVDTAASFTDVEPNAWYAKAIAWAEQNGIVNGVGDNRFNPNGIITREAVVTMLYRYEKLQNPELEATDVSVLAAFTDKTSVSEWAAEGMRWAVSAKVINGKDSSHLVPGGSALRCELAQILWKYQTK